MYCTSLVVKVASRCNLNCTYCYVYNKGDDSYLKQPKIMDSKTVKKLLNNILDHCSKNDLEKFLIVFHGGEPLLTGVEFYINFVKDYENIFKNSNKTIDFVMQTNGVLLDENNLNILKSLNIHIGISLDGTIESNNRNRIFHNGKGSYKEIINGFKLTKKIYGNNNANCLCVVDINHNPLEVYQHFKEIEANDVHLLFPDNTHDTNTINKGQLFDWLKAIFDLWYEDKDVQKPKIRPFIDFIGLLLGELNYGNEMYGKRQNKTLVIETNGNIETVDTLKICGNGFTNTNLNIFENELDDIYVENDLARKYYNSHFDLCEKCTMCPLEEICGGGFLGHRHSKAKGFDNPTIYCIDLAKLICYIQNKVYDNLPKDLQDKIEKINYEDIKEFIES